MKIIAVVWAAIVLLSGCGGSSDSTPTDVQSDGGNGNVSGFVTDSSTGAVLQDALVKIDNLESTSAADGSYSIANVGVGQKDIVASKADYQNHSGSVTVAEAMTTSYDIFLNPEPLPVPTDGLVAYFPFDGNASDQSGNENNGVSVGGISYVESERGQALMLDGSSGYIRIADPQQRFSSELTITLWMATEFHWGQPVTKYRYNGLTDGFGLFVTDENGGGGVLPDGSRLFGHASSSQAFDSFAYPSFTLVPSQMTKVSYIYNNGVHALYINNELKQTTTTDNVDIDNEYDILVGTYFDRNLLTIDTFSKGYLGLIDELRIYNRALSEEELSRIP